MDHAMHKAGKKKLKFAKRNSRKKALKTCRAAKR